MAIIKGKGQQSTAISRQSEGNDVFLRALRDGTLITADWKQAAIIAGYGFITNEGAFSLGIVGGGAGTILLLNEPEYVLSVPQGTCIIPLRIGVHVQPGLLVDTYEAEILVGVDQDAAWAGAGTSINVPIYNMNTLCGRPSTCQCEGTFTVDISTDPVMDLELAHKVICYDVTGGAGAVGMELDLVYEPDSAPIINGPAMLCVYWGGTSATIGGFVDVAFLEFPENAFTI